MVGRLAIAAILGGLVGVEREYRGYPAGVRTIALVCLGSALFTEMSSTFGGSDSARVAAQIVTGIGFLGAGVIVREGVTLHGVTTAATIWTSASLGIAVAQGFYVVAVFVALIVVALLEANPLTKRLSHVGWQSAGEGESHPE
ncbi:MAG: MgtC/SapB family protein [Dehalococcoidia bacterium]|nr:MAG: MgtC/SapB family protein [Dehalococcoidia bacterium]